MANTYGALKRVRQTERRTEFNRFAKTRLRHQLRAMRHTLAAKAPSPEAERYIKVVEGLTRRQREVLAGVVEGLPNKLIAYRLGLSIRTVEAYRAAIMDRTGCKNLSELVRLGIHAGI